LLGAMSSRIRRYGLPSDEQGGDEDGDLETPGHPFAALVHTGRFDGRRRLPRSRRAT
jgi:hypothetical protein